MDFGAMISNSPKVITLAFGLLMSIQVQLQDLGGIVGPPLQGCLVGQAVQETALNFMAQRS